MLQRNLIIIRKIYTLHKSERGGNMSRKKSKVKKSFESRTKDNSSAEQPAKIVVEGYCRGVGAGGAMPVFKPQR